MKYDIGKKAFSRPIRMTRDDFGFNLKSEVIENRLDLK